MGIDEAQIKLSEYRCLIGKVFKGAPIADILIVPEGVGLHYITAIEELSEQEESYDALLKDFMEFQIMVTFAHPFLPAVALEFVINGFV